MKNNRPPVVAVIGRKESGKTMVVEYLISRLTEKGIKTASLKHIHDPDFTIDTPGKDTWRHTKAGAKVVVSVAKKEIAIIKRLATPSFDFNILMDLLNTENLDIVFLEGFHSLIAQNNSVFKIVTAKNPRDLSETLSHTAPPILAVSGLISKQSIKLDIETPIINLETNGEHLIQMIEKKVLKKV